MVDSDPPSDYKVARDQDVARMIRTEMTGWLPRRGADWADLMERAEGTPRRMFNQGRLFVYSVSTAALVAIIVMAVIAMTTLDVGPLAGGAQNATTTLP